VVDSEYPSCMRLTERVDGSDLEVIARVQGVMCGRKFPPYLRNPVPTNPLAQIRSLRQHAKITGFGSADFETDYAKIEAIHGLFVQSATGRTVVPIQYLPYEGHLCIESHARYYTDRASAPFEKNLPFGPNVDPSHILSSIQPEELFHGPDNVVEYCRRVPAKEGGDFDPGLFKAGDLVEIAFSFVGIPIKDDKTLLVLLLRGVTLIDDAIRKVRRQ
ncbi:hypothetical protein FA13DRAFT_1604234, partial [Coprinellus micaceus]